MASAPADRLLEAFLPEGGRGVALQRLPFALGDTTAGTEDELQAVVVGPAQGCDLPLTIRESRFFRNMARRSASGEATPGALADLESFLKDSRNVWENSWIRFAEARLSQYARQVFEDDLWVQDGKLVRERSDAQRFRLAQAGEPWLRIPISYALKLALADVIGVQPQLPERVRSEGKRLMRHFLNDNTSPETTSFDIVAGDGKRSLGQRVAREAARRFLLTSLLAAWANRRWGLAESGQRALVYHAPLPSVHQEEVSSCTSDSFYRELFMSPCLSGWRNGEQKHEYMHLCHQVLTRSQLNAVAKLREAGIISNDLIVLPSLSNVSLANNGVHISMGSNLLAKAMLPEFGAAGVKRVGDLAIKIYEHFLALFVGIYSGAPQRIAFTQFHPERLLSFLPHELDFTHLRLLWREWKEKADLKVCGHAVTPYGPRWLDRVIATLFRLRGDCVPDGRLLTYPVAWLCTENASAVDGEPVNTQRLSAELDELGIVDKKMSFYMPLRLRQQHCDGYTGFEARYYSLFPSYERDMAAAAELQQFLLALAYKLVLEDEVSHDDIPVDPTSESERRQPFFFAAAELPAFYVSADSGNRFLRRLLAGCGNTRSSRRHPGQVRVPVREYREALLNFVQTNASELVEAMNMQPLLDELAARCRDKQQQASSRLLHGILGGSGRAATAMEAREFNCMAEEYYRDALRQEHLREAMRHLREDVAGVEQSAGSELRGVLRHTVRVQNLARFIEEVEERLLRDELSAHEITSMLNLLILLIACERHSVPDANHELLST